MASTTNTTTPLLFHYSYMITLTIMLFSSLFSPSNAQVKGCPFDSIYTFGDSNSSTSDGLLMADQLASAFHLPSPNPYMKKDSKFDYGASFAAKGATAMNTTFFVTKSIQLQSANHSLEAQFLSFAAFLDSTCSSHHKCMKKLGRALFFVDQIANNDYKYAFLQGKSIKEVSIYVSQVTRTIRNTIKKLIDAGATNLLVPGSLPMGCLPGYLTMFHKDDPMQYDDNNCLRGLNIFTRLHNDHLRQELMELTLEYPDVHIVYADYFYAFLVLLRNHAIRGFKKQSLMKACCGSGGGPYNFDQGKMCGNQDVTVCSDPTSYMHWDGFHLTQEANKHVVETLISGAGFVYPEFRFPEVMHCTM